MLSIRTGMKVAIIGSRNYAKLHLVRKMVEVLPPGCTLVSGGARGVDTIAEEAASARGLTVQVFPAEWRKYGRGAGIRRNQDIIANADVVLAFWNGISPGTEHSNQLPRRKRTGYANRFAPKPQIWIAIRFFRCKQRGMYPY